MSAEAARLLRERAEGYSAEAVNCRATGHTDDATFCEVIRDELRKVAREIEGKP